MAIQIYCNEKLPNGKPCRSSSQLSERKCIKCGTPFAKDGKTFRVDVSVKGKRITRFAPNLTIARELEASIKADMIREEFDITHHKVKQMATLDDLWKQYLPYAKQHKKTWRIDQYNYETHLQPLFGGKALDGISSFDVERMKASLKDPKRLNKFGRPFTLATIKHQLVLLNRLFNLASKWNIYQGPNPVKSVEMPRLNNEKTEFLTDEELSRLIDVLDNWAVDDSAAYVRFALLTGLRKGEIRKLAWADVDFNRNLITLRDPKPGKDQTVTVSNGALEVLRGLEVTSDYVFPGRNGKQRTDFKGPWYRIKKAAGLPKDFRFHGLRHNFGSCLVSSGIELIVVRELLHHKDIKTTQRYAHLKPDIVRQAALRSEGLLTPKKPAKVLSLKQPV